MRPGFQTSLIIALGTSLWRKIMGFFASLRMTGDVVEMRKLLAYGKI